MGHVGLRGWSLFTSHTYVCVCSSFPLKEVISQGGLAEQTNILFSKGCMSGACGFTSTSIWGDTL